MATAQEEQLRMDSDRNKMRTTLYLIHAHLDNAARLTPLWSRCNL